MISYFKQPAFLGSLKLTKPNIWIPDKCVVNKLKFNFTLSAVDTDTDVW